MIVKKIIDNSKCYDIIIFMKYENINILETTFVGDIHACHGLLVELLDKLPKNKKIVFLGDLVDRGNAPLATLETVNKLVLEGRATALMGNHDWKYLRLFNGNKINLHESQQKTLADVGDINMSEFKRLYTSIYADPTVFLIDTVNKYTASHALASRPVNIYTSIKNNTSFKKCFWTGFLYGRTDPTRHVEGHPDRKLRIPLTNGVSDDFGGWKSIIGHYHTKELFIEDGNPHVMCIDFCAGEGGRLCGITFNENGEHQLFFSDSYA
jgi:hypothetical protein